MTKQLDTCHLHEVMHGTRLVADLLVKVFHGYESGTLVRRADAKVSAAFDRALEAVEELYQATGNVEPQLIVCPDFVPKAPEGGAS